MEHTQKPTPIRTDNSAATGFIYDNIHTQISKSWDMYYYWLQDRMTQEKIEIYWQRGVDNEVGYFKNTMPQYTTETCEADIPETKYNA